MHKLILWLWHNYRPRVFMKNQYILVYILIIKWGHLNNKTRVKPALYENNLCLMFKLPKENDYIKKVDILFNETDSVVQLIILEQSSPIYRLPYIFFCFSPQRIFTFFLPSVLAHQCLSFISISFHFLHIFNVVPFFASALSLSNINLPKVSSSSTHRVVDNACAVWLWEECQAAPHCDES